MKKSFLLMPIFILCIATIFFNVFAHPGRTDRNGGHWDRSNGTYHYHSGEYAGRNSSSSSSASEYVPFTPPTEPPEPPSDSSKVHSSASPKTSSDLLDNQNNKKDDWHGLLWFFIIMFVAPLLFIYIFAGIFIFFEEYISPKNIRNYEKELKSYKDIQKSLCTLKVEIPPNCEIGEDGLPRIKGSVNDWGKIYTLYTSSSGSKLHAQFGCYAAFYPTHICEHYDKFYYSFSLCKKCTKQYKAPDMLWYENYKELKSTEEKLKNAELAVNELHKKCNSQLFVFFSQHNIEKARALRRANRDYEKLFIKK